MRKNCNSMTFDITISNFGSIHNPLRISSMLIREIRITNSGFRKIGLGYGPFGPSRLMVLVGDNETGKTTTISAFQCLRSLVTKGKHLGLQSNFFQHFNYDNCSYRIHFLSGNTPYLYVLNLQEGYIINEELFNRPNRRPTLLYKRSRISEGLSDLSFGNALQMSPAEKEVLSTVLSDNQTVLSAYSNLNFHNRTLEIAWRYFSTQYCVSNINDFTISAEQFTSIYPDLFNELIVMTEKGIHIGKETFDKLIILGQIAGRCLRSTLETNIFHESMAQFRSTLSSGVYEFIITLITLMMCIRNNEVCVIDDFGEKMDFNKAYALLDYYLSKESYSQLFLSTHSSLLLDYEKLRREQVVFLYRDTNGSISADQKLAKTLHKSISLTNAYNKGLRPKITNNNKNQNIDTDDT